MLYKFNKFLAKLFKYPEEFIKNNLTNIYTRKSKIDIDDTLFINYLQLIKNLLLMIMKKIKVKIFNVESNFSLNFPLSFMY